MPGSTGLASTPTCTLPLTGWTRPAMMRKSVDFPIPEGPRSATTCPVIMLGRVMLRISKLTSRSTIWSAYPWLTPLTFSSVSLYVYSQDAVIAAPGSGSHTDR